MVHADFATPPVNGDEEEQPDHINEVPVPSGSFEAEMAVFREMAKLRTAVAYIEKDRSDKDVETVETGSHEEC